MSTIRTELSRIAAKVETTEGTAISLAASDGDILASNVTWTWGVPAYERNARTATFSQFASVSGSQMATLSFDVDMYANSSTAPGYDALFKACSIVGSAVSTTYVYGLVSAAASIPSLTISAYVDGRLRQMVGARGTVKMAATTGNPWKLSFSFQGAAVAPTDTTLLADATYTANSKVPPALLGGSFSCGGLSTSEALLRSIEFDIGNGLTMRTDANASTGYRSCALTGRKVTGQFVIEMPTVTEHDLYSTMTANTLAALAVSSGTSTGKISFAAPKVQYTDVQESDDGELLIATVKFACRINSGNDELAITLGV